MKRALNKNPNCNHNASTVSYYPQYQKVWYQAQDSKKEEILKQVFFKESARVSNTSESPLTKLKIIDHALANTVFIKDL